MRYIYRGIKTTEDGLKGIFEACLNEELSNVGILGYSYGAGTVLRRVDEKSFNAQFRAWADIQMDEQQLDTY